MKTLKEQIPVRRLLPAILALTAIQCTKAEIEESPVTPSDGKTVTLTVRSAAPSTRTSIDGTTGQVFWSEGDMITVNGDVYEVTPDENDPTVATVENVTESDYKNSCCHDCFFDFLESCGKWRYRSLSSSDAFFVHIST